MFSFSESKGFVNQSAVNEAETRFPRLRLALNESMTASLRPGDVLFLPASWSHLVFVDTGSGSVSWNVWSEPEIGKLRKSLEGAISMGLNGMIAPSWSKPAMIAATRDFLRQVDARVGQKEFAQDHFESRYKPLLQKEAGNIAVNSINRKRFCTRF